MRKSLPLMLALCALTTGCQTRSAPTACDGWQMLRPSLETAVAITTKDRPFANQVAAHNAHGRKQGCW